MAGELRCCGDGLVVVVMVLVIDGLNIIDRPHRDIADGKRTKKNHSGHGMVNMPTGFRGRFDLQE